MNKPATIDSNDKADRPTLRKAPANQPRSHEKTQGGASVSDAGGLLSDDPGRPHLHRSSMWSRRKRHLHNLPRRRHRNWNRSI